MEETQGFCSDCLKTTNELFVAGHSAELGYYYKGGEICQDCINKRKKNFIKFSKIDKVLTLIKQAIDVREEKEKLEPILTKAKALFKEIITS